MSEHATIRILLLLRAKAEGSISGIEAMTDGRHSNLPEHMATDYNDLIRMATKLMPDAESLLPPATDVVDVGEGRRLGEMTYNEVLICCYQILRMVDAHLEDDA